MGGTHWHTDSGFSTDADGGGKFAAISFHEIQEDNIISNCLHNFVTHEEEAEGDTDGTGEEGPDLAFAAESHDNEQRTDGVGDVVGTVREADQEGAAHLEITVAFSGEHGLLVGIFDRF